MRRRGQCKTTGLRQNTICRNLLLAQVIRYDKEPIHVYYLDSRTKVMNLQHMRFRSQEKGVTLTRSCGPSPRSSDMMAILTIFTFSQLQFCQ